MIKPFTSIHTCDNGTVVTLTSEHTLVGTIGPVGASLVTLTVSECRTPASTFGYVAPEGDGKFKLILNGLGWASEYGAVRCMDVLVQEYDTEAAAERMLLRTLTTVFYNAVKEIRFRELDQLVQ